MGSLGRYVRVAILCLTWISATTFAQEKFFDSNGVRIRAHVEQGSEHDRLDSRQRRQPQVMDRCGRADGSAHGISA